MIERLGTTLCRVVKKDLYLVVTFTDGDLFKEPKEGQYVGDDVEEANRR